MKKNILIIVAAIAAVVAGGVSGTEAWLRQRIRHAVEQAVGETGAQVEIGRVSVSLPRRSVSVHNIGIRVQNRNAAHRGFTVVALDAALPVIAVRGIRYKKRGEKRALSADAIAIEAPRIALVTRSVRAEGTDHRSDTPAVQNKNGADLSEKLASLEVGGIFVSDAAFDLVQWISEGENTHVKLWGGNFSAFDLRGDSLPADMRLSADSIVYGFGAGAQVLRADGLAFETAAGNLTLERLALVPQFGRDEFAQKSAGHEDWTAVTIEGVECRGVDYARAFAEKTIVINSVALARADIASYKNRKVFRQPRTKPMLYQTIQRLPVPVDIGTLAFENLDVTYDELSEHGDTPGRVAKALRRTSPTSSKTTTVS